MEAVIKNGSVEIPENIRAKIGLPENGVCKIDLLDREIRIICVDKPKDEKLSVIDDIKSSPKIVSIKEIMKAEVVDAD